MVRTKGERHPVQYPWWTILDWRGPSPTLCRISLWTFYGFTVIWYPTSKSLKRSTSWLCLCPCPCPRLVSMSMAVSMFTVMQYEYGPKHEHKQETGTRTLKWTWTWTKMLEHEMRSWTLTWTLPWTWTWTLANLPFMVMCSAQGSPCWLDSGPYSNGRKAVCRWYHQWASLTQNLTR
jgi:hypothetical protein